MIVYSRENHVVGDAISDDALTTDRVGSSGQNGGRGGRCKEDRGEDEREGFRQVYRKRCGVLERHLDERGSYSGEIGGDVGKMRLEIGRGTKKGVKDGWQVGQDGWFRSGQVCWWWLKKEGEQRVYLRCEMRKRWKG